MRVVVLAIPALVVLAYVTNPGLLRPLISDPLGRVLALLAAVVFAGMTLALSRITRVTL